MEEIKKAMEEEELEEDRVNVIQHQTAQLMPQFAASGDTVRQMTSLMVILMQENVVLHQTVQIGLLHVPNGVIVRNLVFDYCFCIMKNKLTRSFRKWK